MLTVAMSDVYRNIPGGYAPVVPSVAANLARLRRAHALTQEQLANAAGLKQADISKYENGTVPDLARLLQLAAAMREPIDEFVVGVFEPYDQLCQTRDQGSAPHRKGGADVSAAARIVELERENAQLKATVSAMQDVADNLIEIAAERRTNADAPKSRAGKRRA